MSARANLVRKKISGFSKSRRAGLVFPVARILRYLKFHQTHKNNRISPGAAVYTAAVLEYLCAEVLEMASNTTAFEKKKLMTPRHIMFAIMGDQELKEMLNGVTIPFSGVIPRINQALLNKSPSSGVKKASTTGAIIKKKVAAAPAKIIVAAAAKSKVKIPTAPKKRHCAHNCPDTLKKAKVVTVVKKKVKTPTTPKKRHCAHNCPDTPKKTAAASPANRMTGGPRSITILNEKTLHLGQKLTVVKGDLTDIAADAVVHPTNSSYYTGGEVGQALARKGGVAFQAEINKLKADKGSLNVGEAAVCVAHNIPASIIVHCHGPNWNTANSVALLENTVKHCLSLADDKNFQSIAFPSIGSGRAGFPKQTAAETILRTIHAYFSSRMQSSIRQVYFVLYDMESVGVYTSELEKLI